LLDLITAGLKLIPGVGLIMSLFDKWFGETPEQKAVRLQKKKEQKMKDRAMRRDTAIKEAKRGNTKKVKDIITGSD